MGHFFVCNILLTVFRRLTLVLQPMKRLFLFSAILFFYACNDSGSAIEPGSEAENDLDAARIFIENALDGKWEEAKQFLIQDSTNVQLLSTAEAKYNSLDREEKRSYREAEPRFHGTRKINDSITIVNYSNSYMNKKDSLKVVLINGQWLIDLKYSLLPNSVNVQ
jgi:hypothetical protein